MTDQPITHSEATDPAQSPDGFAPIADASPARIESAPTPAHVDPEPDDDADLPDYFGVVRSLKAGEKLQLMAKLGVTEQQLNVTGVAQLMAVAWKHRKSTTGQPKITDLLDKTDTELLDVIGLTDDQYIEQVTAFAATKGDDD